MSQPEENIEGESLKNPVDSFTEAVKKRTYIRQRISYINGKVLAGVDDLTLKSINIFICDLETYRTQLDTLNIDIFSALLIQGKNQEYLDESSAKEQDYEDKITSSLAQLRSLIGVNMNNSVQGDFRANIPANRLKLPEIKLPRFGNKHDESLEKFIYEFESILSKHQLSCHERFIYLKNQLYESPKLLINSLDITEQKYNSAKELLMKAFASSIVQKYTVIKKLSMLNLPHDGDPYSYVGEIKSITNSFKHLKIDIETVIQFFVWQGFNDKFQNYLVQITNENTPSLSQINDNIFQAISRFIGQNKKSQNKHRSDKQKSDNSLHVDRGNIFTQNETASYAMNVHGTLNNSSGGYNWCILCENDKLSASHRMRDCTIYDTPKRKVEKLSSIKACTKCSFKSHDTSKCRFKFKSKCIHCNGFHFSFLCNSNKREHVISNMSSVKILNCKTGDDSVILPTLSCHIKHLNSERVRVFKDGGCQRNMILTHLADKYKLSIVKNDISLNIQGFNSSKSFVTKVVTVPVILNGVTCNIDAICVPVINTKLHLDGLDKVVKHFLMKGYTLADKMLICPDKLDIIDNIGLILGSDSDHLLELCYRSFGNKYPKSSYIESSIGVLLSGNVNRMLCNMGNLPNCTNILPIDSRNSIINNSFSAINKLPKFDIFDDLFEGIGESCINVYNNQCLTVINNDGQIIESELNKVTEMAIKEQSSNYLNYDCDAMQVETDTNLKLVNYVLNNATRSDSGHLVLPLPWNYKIVHLLGHNYNLSKQILKSNLNKLKQFPDKLKMYDEVFKEQVNLGIIEKIDNLNEFIESHPESSFLPHMGIFKMDRDTSKCRVVFLSNLCETNSLNPNAVSHNQAMLPGPCLNHKISTSLIMLRFDKFLFTFDIKKAFLNISLRESDQNRLAFLWYRDVARGNYDIVGYKNLKLSFGLRSSPCILMLALFKILILDTENDSDNIRDIKRAVFNTVYMDNCGYSTNNENDLKLAYDVIPKLFQPYGFYLQQFYTNSPDLESKIDSDFSTESINLTKVLGMMWDRKNDTLMPVKIRLDCEANTKRSILSTVNSVYDIFNIYSPILNRSKLFLQKLLNDSSLKWDTVVSESLLKEWRNITKQINKTPQITVPRFVGERKSKYKLIAFTDASQAIYGVVVYIKDLSSNKISYLTSKSRLVSKNQTKKTIPVLEFMGICLGAELLEELYFDLCGESTVIPVNISSMELFTDSMVSLHWIRGYIVEYAKMQRRSVFILNRLKTLNTLCENFPITFDYIDGKSNPADYLTRETSYNQIMKTEYYAGPNFLCTNYNDYSSDLCVTVPNPVAAKGDEIPSGLPDVQIQVSHVTRTEKIKVISAVTHLISPDRYSSWDKLVGVYSVILKFINKLKCLSQSRKTISFVGEKESNYRSLAISTILSVEQSTYYEEICSFFKNNKFINNKDVPNLINQLNLIYEDGLIKVKGKFPRSDRGYPILLAKKSPITLLIIGNIHEHLSHSGIYTVLREMRPFYWIPHCFSVVKGVLKNCVTCRRLNEKCIEVNQNDYRDFRMSPPEVPFSYVFLDYAGPWQVKIGGCTTKVWLLLVTCLWSRSVNIKICSKLDACEFLRAVQLHIYDHGIFQMCMSDLGSQICAGSSIIKNFIDDMETENFLQSHGIKSVQFDHFPKGNSTLGSLIESCVKQVKRLISKSIKNTILNYSDFEFIIAKVNHMVNRRPVAFKDSLRSLPDGEVPTSITPECLIKGRELVSLNIVPEIQTVDIEDPDWSPNEPTATIKNKYFKLKKVRDRLVNLYHSEFLANLAIQATNKKDRYRKSIHKNLRKGDIVLLNDKFLKQSSYPMGIVTEVKTNSLGEVTSAMVKKGSTGETVFRHSSSLILLLQREDSNEVEQSEHGRFDNSVLDSAESERVLKRQSALKCSELNRKLISESRV